MKRSILAMAAVTLSLACLTENAAANGPSMAKKTAPAPNAASKTPSSYRPLPGTTRTTPRTTTVVVRPQTPRVAPTVTVVSGTSGGTTLTNNAHVGYNPTTGRYAIAFDAPGVSGTGILIQSGYSITVLGPTNWTSAVAYLKSIGAPGW